MPAYAVHYAAMNNVSLNPQADGSIRVREALLGSRIDTKPFRADETLAINPLTVAIPGGCAVLFRYGVAVFFGMATEQESQFLERLLSLTHEPRTWSEDELLNLRTDADQLEGVDAQGCLWLHDTSAQRLQLVVNPLTVQDVAKVVVIAQKGVFLADHQHDVHLP